MLLLLHYLVKCTEQIVHVKLRQETADLSRVSSKQPRSEPSRLRRSWLSCNVVVSTRQKSVAPMNWNGEWLMSGVASNSWLLTWLLTTGVAIRACIRSKGGHIAYELMILILLTPVTFGITFVWQLPCYNLHSKSVPATSTISTVCLFF